MRSSVRGRVDRLPAVGETARVPVCPSANRASVCSIELSCTMCALIFCAVGAASVSPHCGDPRLGCPCRQRRPGSLHQRGGLERSHDSGVTCDRAGTRVNAIFDDFTRNGSRLAQTCGAQRHDGLECERATAVTDAAGNFSVVVTSPPGTVMPLSVSVRSLLQYGKAVTVADEPALRCSLSWSARRAGAA